MKLLVAETPWRAIFLTARASSLRRSQQPFEDSYSRPVKLLASLISVVYSEAKSYWNATACLWNSKKATAWLRLNMDLLPEP